MHFSVQVKVIMRQIDLESPTFAKCTIPMMLALGSSNHAHLNLIAAFLFRQGHRTPMKDLEDFLESYELALPAPQALSIGYVGFGALRTAIDRALAAGESRLLRSGLLRCVCGAWVWVQQ